MRLRIDLTLEYHENYYDPQRGKRIGKCVLPKVDCIRKYLEKHNTDVGKNDKYWKFYEAVVKGICKKAGLYWR